MKHKTKSTWNTFRMSGKKYTAFANGSSGWGMKLFLIRLGNFCFFNPLPLIKQLISITLHGFQAVRCGACMYLHRIIFTVQWSVIHRETTLNNLRRCYVFNCSSFLGSSTAVDGRPSHKSGRKSYYFKQQLRKCLNDTSAFKEQAHRHTLTCNFII